MHVLVSLPVPVVGQQNSTLLHVPVVPLVLASRARVVVGTGFPLLFHFTYHYYSPVGYSKCGSHVVYTLPPDQQGGLLQVYGIYMYDT